MEKIEAYKTSDGRVFEKSEDAREHEGIMKLVSLFKVGLVYGEPVSSSDFGDFLINAKDKGLINFTPTEAYEMCGNCAHMHLSRQQVAMECSKHERNQTLDFFCESWELRKKWSDQ